MSRLVEPRRLNLHAIGRALRAAARSDVPEATIELVASELRAEVRRATRRVTPNRLALSALRGAVERIRETAHPDESADIDRIVDALEVEIRAAHRPDRRTGATRMEEVFDELECHEEVRDYVAWAIRVEPRRTGGPATSRHVLTNYLLPARDLEIVYGADCLRYALQQLLDNDVSGPGWPAYARACCESHLKWLAQ